MNRLYDFLEKIHTSRRYIDMEDRKFNTGLLLPGFFVLQ